MHRVRIESRKIFITLVCTRFVKLSEQVYVRMKDWFDFSYQKIILFLYVKEYN